MYPAAIEELTRSCLDLGRHLPLARKEELEELSGRVAASFKYRLDESTLFSDTLFARQRPAKEEGEIWQRPDNGE